MPPTASIHEFFTLGEPGVFIGVANNLQAFFANKYRSIITSPLTILPVLKPLFVKSFTLAVPSALDTSVRLPQVLSVLLFTFPNERLSVTFSVS